ncbi:hypothetical protein C0Q70_07771 [Pomacea canaliculata]|uniref:Uncharacterized protein n=1 Tax=Pomacea canaliculata TaxID=400727 RepID=A0A2T7PFZ1_POMCA|nr:hypothetical protein C0Q70_07771 [Pomacea canaliculata]
MDTPSFTENLKNAEQFKLSGNDAFKSMDYPSLLASSDPKNEKVIEYCKKSLAINPDNLKAVFRMGTALANLGQYEKAKEVLTSHKAYGREKKIVQLLVQVEKKIKEGDENSKKLYQRMFQSKSTRPLSHTEQIKEHFPQDPQKLPKADSQVLEEEGCSAEQTRGQTTEKNRGDIDKDSSLVSECFKEQPDNISDLGSPLNSYKELSTRDNSSKEKSEEILDQRQLPVKCTQDDLKTDSKGESFAKGRKKHSLGISYGP